MWLVALVLFLFLLLLWSLKKAYVTVHYGGFGVFAENQIREF